MNELINKLTKIVNSNYRDKFNNELIYLEKLSVNTSENEENKVLGTELTREQLINRITLLKQILTNYDNQTAETLTIINQENECSKLTNMFTATDKLTYGREWKKLAPIHKIIKIKEFFNFLPETSFKQELIDKLEKLLNEKKLKETEHIVYDPEQLRITELNCFDLAKSDQEDIIVL